MAETGLLRAPETVVLGTGAVEQLGKLTLQYGSRALLCTDPGLASGDHAARATRSLRSAGLSVTVLDAAVPELPRPTVEAAIGNARSARPDVIVGFGGGSSLDLAKLIALSLAWPGPLERYYGEFKVPGPCLPVVAVPTTAGTGSEVTPVAVLSDPVHRLKVGISSPNLVPRVALCDPLVTHGAPPAVTAQAGIDAVAHAIEAFTAVERSIADATARVFVGKNVLSDGFALHALRCLGPALERAADDEPDARARALEGSLCAGLAFATAGTALAHALQYPVGAITKTPHGVGVGLLLPHVMRFNAPVRAAELAQAAQAMAFGSSADAAIEGVANVAARLGIPKALEELGVERHELPSIADHALTIDRLIANNPRHVDHVGALAVLQAAWAA